MKRTSFSAVSSRLNSIQALARVAWPHRSTSALRREPAQVVFARAGFHEKGGLGEIVLAPRCVCISAVIQPASSGTMAAGLPSSGLLAKASTCQSLSFMASPNA